MNAALVGFIALAAGAATVVQLLLEGQQDRQLNDTLARKLRLQRRGDGLFKDGVTVVVESRDRGWAVTASMDAPSGCPDFTLIRRSLVHLGKSAVRLGDTAFDGQWVVLTAWPELMQTVFPFDLDEGIRDLLRIDVQDGTLTMVLSTDRPEKTIRFALWRLPRVRADLTARRWAHPVGLDARSMTHIEGHRDGIPLSATVSVSSRTTVLKARHPMPLTVRRRSRPGPGIGNPVLDRLVQAQGDLSALDDNPTLERVLQLVHGQGGAIESWGLQRAVQGILQGPELDAALDELTVLARTLNDDARCVGPAHPGPVR